MHFACKSLVVERSQRNEKICEPLVVSQATIKNVLGSLFRDLRREVS